MTLKVNSAVQSTVLNLGDSVEDEKAEGPSPKATGIASDQYTIIIRKVSVLTTTTNPLRILFELAFVLILESLIFDRINDYVLPDQPLCCESIGFVIVLVGSARLPHHLKVPEQLLGPFFILNVSVFSVMVAFMRFCTASRMTMLQSFPRVGIPLCFGGAIVSRRTGSWGGVTLLLVLGAFCHHFPCPPTLPPPYNEFANVILLILVAFIAKQPILSFIEEPSEEIDVSKKSLYRVLEQTLKDTCKVFMVLYVLALGIYFVQRSLVESLN